MGVLPCGTPVKDAQHNSRSFKGYFGEYLSELGEWGASVAQPYQSPVEAIGVIDVARTIELPHMLLLTRKEFGLNFIEVYLQFGQSILQDGLHQL